MKNLEKEDSLEPITDLTRLREIRYRWGVLAFPSQARSDILFLLERLAEAQTNRYFIPS